MKLLAAILVLAVATPCAAVPLQPWIGASGSYNTYAMDEVNAQIADLNALLPSASMDELDSGIGFGLSVGADVERWSFSIGYDRLPASTELSGTSVGYDLAANSFLGRAAYRLPLNAKFGISVGLGAGIASASGDIGRSDSQPLARIGRSTHAVIYEGGAGVSGTAFSYEGFAEGDVPLGGKFSLVPSIGYRAAKIDAEIGDGVSSSSMTLDFSGMAARLGLRFAL